MSACPHCGYEPTERQVALALRNKLIVAAHRGGAGQREIAKQFGVSRPRVSQIVGAAS